MSGSNLPLTVAESILLSAQKGYEIKEKDQDVAACELSLNPVR